MSVDVKWSLEPRSARRATDSRGVRDTITNMDAKVESRPYGPRRAPSAAVRALPYGAAKRKREEPFCLRQTWEPAMNRFFQLSRCFAAVSLAAAPVASSSSSAHILVVPGCEAAEQLNDGSWKIRSTRTFGRAGEVDVGSIIWRGTVINGVDLGAFLEKRCFTDLLQLGHTSPA